jgi:hypothetical protein
VFGFGRNGCSASVGIGVRHQSDGPFGFTRNPHKETERVGKARLNNWKLCCLRLPHCEHADAPEPDRRFVCHHADGGDGRGNADREEYGGGDGMLAHLVEQIRIVDTYTAHDDDVKKLNARRAIEGVRIVCTECHAVLHGTEPKKRGRPVSGRPWPPSLRPASA